MPAREPAEAPPPRSRGERERAWLQLCFVLLAIVSVQALALVLLVVTETEPARVARSVAVPLGLLAFAAGLTSLRLSRSRMGPPPGHASRVLPFRQRS